MWKFAAFQRVGHFDGPDRPIQMSLVVGVGLDVMLCRPVRLRGLADRPAVPSRWPPTARVLFHHSFVVIGGDRGEPLRDQVIQGVAVLDLNHVPLFAKMLDRLHQQQFDAAVRSLGQRFVRWGTVDFFDSVLTIVRFTFCVLKRNIVAAAGGLSRSGIIRLRRAGPVGCIAESWSGGAAEPACCRGRGALPPVRPGRPVPSPPISCIRSQITFNFDRFWPSCPSHVSSLSRPSMKTGEPLLRYSLITSAVRPQTVTSTNVTSSIHSPLAFFRLFVDGQSDIGDRHSALDIAQLDVPSEIAYQDYAVEAGHMDRSLHLFLDFGHDAFHGIDDGNGILDLLVADFRFLRRGGDAPGPTRHGRPGRRRSAARPSGTIREECRR